MTETYYTWKIWSKTDKMYYTPRGDPMQYEYAFDFVFNTPDDAKSALEEWDVLEEARDENWVLVKVTSTYEPVSGIEPRGEKL